MAAPPRAAIIGLSGPALLAEEAALLEQARPLGVILFARNIRDPGQLQGLIASVRAILGEEAPVLIDQEGGRVARLRPPHWPALPAAAAFAGAPAEAISAHAAGLGRECRALGIDVVCAPVLDLRLPEGHQVIGDRAFSADPAEVARCGEAWARGLIAAGVVPVMKHIPGHGRAAADSHLELPRVAADRTALAADHAPFRALSAALGARLWAMTAHVLYEALDPGLPATLSPAILQGLIRREIGFPGFLISDDLAMGALSGPLPERAEAALAAGCDAVLHGPGDAGANRALLAAVPPLGEAALERLAGSRGGACHAA
ncbi:MAG: beta-N-acetylhexosaminidase [Rhodovarius sp.]|nr:beta-N-acetylhexosaminidase [Rhodovarius sp.]